LQSFILRFRFGDQENKQKCKYANKNNRINQ